MPKTAANVAAKLSGRLRKLYTGAITDIMDGMGYREQFLPSDIRPLDPRMKVAGPAYTVRGRARHWDDGKDPRYRQIEMLEHITPASVVLVDPGDDTVAAHWGELMSNVARAQGATGAVIAGGLRDSEKILEIGFPVFRRYHSPLTAVWRWELTDFNVPMRMGMVTVRPGDYLLGDIDGVVVIPVKIVEVVLTKAEEVTRKETVVRKSLQKGGSIRELFERHRVF
jgi:4-hydroxy-4-methyl-2-oxoglutarate aldolase